MKAQAHSKKQGCDDGRGRQQAPLDVTVVVPAYNAEATLGRCLEALLTQDYATYNVIVVDNNSSDQTADVARRYPVTIASERDVQSAGAARNRGIALARAPFIAFIDADCIADRYWLARLMQPFRDPQVGIVGGKITSRTVGTSLVDRWLGQVELEALNPSEPKAFPSGNLACRRRVFELVGVFDAAMYGGEDDDLAWRAQAYAGFEGVYVPHAIVYHEQHGTLRGLYRQQRRYGLSEIVLSTLYRRERFHQRTPAYELTWMAKQVGALGIYCASFLVRLLRWRRWRADGMYLAEPLLRFVTESGNLVGKSEGLWRTRFFRRNPFPSAREIKREFTCGAGLLLDEAMKGSSP